MRKIIHIDMDCFYAAVEIRDDPGLNNLPVAVGGSNTARGVICTCNYVARKYGIHSAMATSKACSLCPDLIVLPVNMQKYKEVAQGIQEIFFHYTEIVEPISLDEAYLDVTECTLYQGSATWIASSIRNEIFTKFKLTASAGVAPNKFLAKIASDWNKPNGQFVIEPDQIREFIQRVKIEKINGVGKVTARKLHALGIYICQDIQNYSLEKLSQEFGKFGQRLFDLSFGRDDRQVQPNWNRKSLSVERTFAIDINSIADARNELITLYAELQRRLQEHGHRRVCKQFVKIKFNNFFSTTVEKTSAILSISLITDLFIEGHNRQELPIRLLGIGVRFVDLEEPQQLQLLDSYQ